MKTPEEKAELLRQQVNAKIIWGARDREVLDWLQERHGITDEAANDLLAEGYRAKRAAVRNKALVHLAFSTFGILVAGGFILLQATGRFLVVGYGTILLVLIGFVSVATFFRSLFRLLTGNTQGSVH